MANVKNWENKKIEKLNVNSLLAKLDDNINVIINDMYDKSLQNSDISKRLKNKYDSIELKEIPKNENGAAYTINKGDIYMCIIKDNKLNDINDAMFVLLHELAHLKAFKVFSSNIKPHGQEWKDSFIALMYYPLRTESFPDDIKIALMRHMKNPKASSVRDIELRKV